MITGCSWCGRYKVRGSWEFLQEMPTSYRTAIAKLKEQFRVSHGVCSYCMSDYKLDKLTEGPHL